MKKRLAVLITGFVILLSPFLSTTASAQAKTSPAWPFGSGCSSKELGKTKSNNSQICVKSGNSYKWVKVLSKNDVYDLSPFCSQTIKSERSGAACGWNEKLGLALVANNRPKDICIKAMRQIVYEQAQMDASGRYVSSAEVSASAYKILADTGCWK